MSMMRDGRTDACREPHVDGRPLSAAEWLNRREFLGKMGTGLGSIALTYLLSMEGALAAVGGAKGAVSPLAPRAPHFAPKAKRVIQIFCPRRMYLSPFNSARVLILAASEPACGSVSANAPISSTINATSG